MPQSLAAIYVHLVYSTKNRQSLIRPDIGEEKRFRLRRWLKNSRKARPGGSNPRGRSSASSTDKADTAHFSIGQSGIEVAKRYIAKQKEHHRIKTFQEEFRALLAKYHIEYDERYVWD